MRNLVLGFSRDSGELTWIPKNLRFRHLYMLGRTGAGKSSLMHRLIHQDAKKNYAVVVLDSGDLAPALVNTLSDEALGRVTVFSFEQKRVIPYNPLVRRRDEPGRLENEAFDLIDQIAAEAANTQPLSARMKRILSAALANVLRESDPNFATLVTHLLERQEELRAALGLNKAEFALSLEGVIDRLSLFLKDERLRRVICAPHRLDYDQILDQGQILLLSLAGLEKPFVRFLGTLLLNGLWATIMERPPERRMPVAIYIDEFQDYLGSRYAVQNFQTIFAQGRRHKASLCVAHQDFGTIDTKLLHTIHANAASVVSFSCGPDEATRLKKLFGDVGNIGFLPDHQAITRVGRTVTRIRTYPPPKHVRRIEEHQNEWSDAPPPNPLDRISQRPVAPARTDPKPETSPPSATAARKPPSPPATRGTTLSYDQRKFLQYTAEDPQQFVTKIYTALGLSGYKGDRIKRSLIEDGLITQEETREGAGGRPAKRIALTAKGQKVLEGLTLPGKGGERHKDLQQMIAEQAELAGWKATVEERIDGSADSVDIGLEKREIRVAVEVSVTTDAENELGNITKCLSGGYDHVICAVSEEATLQAVRTKVRKTLTLDERRKVRFGPPAAVRRLLQEIEDDGKGLVSERNEANSVVRNQKPLFAAKEAAEFLGVSRLTLYSWVSQRKIPFVKVGRLTKFRREDLTTWLERRRTEEDRRDFLT